MASTLPDLQEPPEHSDSEPLTDGFPDASVLDDKMPEWFRVTWKVPAYVAALGVISVLLNFLPLHQSDLWSHLAYGKVIVTEGLPDTEPLMELSKGVRFVSTAWLSQVVGHFTYESAGVAGLRFLFAGSLTALLACLVVMGHRKTGRAGWTLAGAALALWVSWEPYTVIRPQLAGLVCFGILLVMLTGRGTSKQMWWGIPVLFAFWANLHGSFAIGLLVMAAFTVGRATDLLLRSGKLASLTHDRTVRRLFLLTELAFVATLLNPYGLGLHAEVLSIRNNPNLLTLAEWSGWEYAQDGGFAFVVAVVSLAALYRFSPRRVQTVEVLLLVGFGVAMLKASRMSVWFAPVAGYYFTLHASASFQKWRAKRNSAAESLPGSKWTVAAIGLCWIFLALSPIWTFFRTGKQTDLEDAATRLTPVRAVAYLNEHPETGLAWATFEFSDYLLYAGPEELRSFVSSQVHLIPPDVWSHYLRISELGGDWGSLLDKYGVNTVLASPRKDAVMLRRLYDSNEWSREYGDNVCVIMTRDEPL